MRGMSLLVEASVMDAFNLAGSNIGGIAE